MISLRGWKVAIVGLAIGLSACSSFSGQDMNPAVLVTGGRDIAKEQETAEKFAVVAVCPEIQVRDGTQLLRIYERGMDGDNNALRFQGTVQKFARECRTDPATGATTIKVGVAGRLLSGPKGATGAVNLPLRIVVVKNGDELLYSELQPVAAEIPTGQSAMTWSKVVEGIVIPAEPVQSRYIIYVGFDEVALRS
jgi:hypothetical protein